MTTDQLQNAKKVQTAISNGIKPPAVLARRHADTYCSDPTNMEECLTFATQAGIMDPQNGGMRKKF